MLQSTSLCTAATEPGTQLVVLEGWVLIRTDSRKSIWLGLLVFAVALLAISFGTANAVQVEPSILDWWTNNQAHGAVSSPWGNTYGQTGLNWGVGDLWNLMYANGTRPDADLWTAGDGTSNEGAFVLQVEYAGNKNINEFGWYDPTNPTARNHDTDIYTGNVLFPGPAGPGTVATHIFTAGQTFGFYFTNTESHTTFYSDQGLNGGYRQARVFVDPSQATWAHPTDWVMCWEDLPNSGFANYAETWTTPSTLAWGHDNSLDREPDYQDMILRFHIEAETFDNPTPELPTFLLAALSLAAIPVLRRRRRS